MATPSSTFTWKIPRTEEHGGLYSPWSCKESDKTGHTQKILKIYVFKGRVLVKLIIFTVSPRTLLSERGKEKRSRSVVPDSLRPHGQ